MFLPVPKLQGVGQWAKIAHRMVHLPVFYKDNLPIRIRCGIWSGKHHWIVNGINICTLLWTNGNAINDHFRDMLRKAKERSFQPRMVLFDSWYASIDNLKTIRKFGWHWLTRLKKNRLVNPDNTKNMQIQEIEIPLEGREVHLKAYGFIKVLHRILGN